MNKEIKQQIAEEIWKEIIWIDHSSSAEVHNTIETILNRYL